MKLLEKIMTPFAWIGFLLLPVLPVYGLLAFIHMTLSPFSTMQMRILFLFLCFLSYMGFAKILGITNDSK